MKSRIQTVLSSLLLIVTLCSGSSVVAAKEVVLTTPFFCPLVCEDEDGLLVESTFITMLASTLKEMGHTLKIQIDTQNRARTMTAIGRSDLTLGLHKNLQKSNRLNIQDQPIGSSPLQVIYNAKRNIDVQHVDDLLNYRMTWNNDLGVHPRFQAIINSMASADKLEIIEDKNFVYGALRRIHNRQSDVVLLPKTSYDEVIAKYKLAYPNAEFAVTPAFGIPEHDVYIASSKKSTLSKTDLAMIHRLMARFAAKHNADVTQLYAQALEAQLQFTQN